MVESSSLTMNSQEKQGRCAVSSTFDMTKTQQSTEAIAKLHPINQSLTVHNKIPWCMCGVIPRLCLLVLTCNKIEIYTLYINCISISPKSFYLLVWNME